MAPSISSSIFPRLGWLRPAQVVLLVLLLSGVPNGAAGSSVVKIDPKTGKPEEGTCEMVGDVDLYGLGVRLGRVYES